MNDDAIRRLPLFQELFDQWRTNRGALVPDSAKLPFSRAWEKLLEDAGLVTAEQRSEALRDADTLEANGWVKTTRDRSRRYQILRIAIPLAAEPRLRTLFADQLPASSSPFDAAAVAWAPELEFVPATRLQVAAEDLLKLNAFLLQGSRERLMVPVKERSLQIFGDEKRLDALRGTTLFRAGRLTLEALRCFVATEPLGWKRGPTAAEPVLVVENAATFDSYARWNAQSAQFSAIVYGGGNRFADSILRMTDIFTELGGPRRVLYFGDLDPAGIRIPRRASNIAQQAGLPPVEPDVQSFRWLLATGQTDVPLPEATGELDDEDRRWLGELSEQVEALLNTGRRLAQEHIGWDFLSRQF